MLGAKSEEQQESPAKEQKNPEIHMDVSKNRGTPKMDGI